MSHQETKQLFKYDPLAWGIQNDGGIAEQRLEYERKINAAFSINTALFFQMSLPSSRYAQSRNIIQSAGFATSIEPRWYYQMAKINYKTLTFQGTIEPRYYYKLNKHIAEGKSAYNLSGPYLALPISLTYQQDNYPRSSFNQVNNIGSDTATLRPIIGVAIGVQKKLFKTGYYDVSAGIGRNNGITLLGKMELGFAF